MELNRKSGKAGWVLSFAVIAMTMSLALVKAAPTKPKVEMLVSVNGKDQRVIIELDDVNAPKTCQNFQKLCREGFYEGTLFHRVIPGYIVQAGDPFSKDASKKGVWGTGGPGYTLAPELGKPHVRGAIAMARLGNAVNPGKESSGSQFYVALDRIESLDNEYTVFGQVVSGLEVMDAVGKAPADRSNVPLDPIVIKKMTVEGGNQEDAIPAPPVTGITPPTPAPVDMNPAEPAPLPIPPIERVETDAPAPPPVATAPSAPAAPVPVASSSSENEIRDITPPRTAGGTSRPPAAAPAGAERPMPASEADTGQIPGPAPGPASGNGKKKGGFLKFIERFW